MKCQRQYKGEHVASSLPMASKHEVAAESFPNPHVQSKAQAMPRRHHQLSAASLQQSIPQQAPLSMRRQTLSCANGLRVGLRIPQQERQRLRLLHAPKPAPLQYRTKRLSPHLYRRPHKAQTPWRRQMSRIEALQDGQGKIHPGCATGDAWRRSPSRQ